MSDENKLKLEDITFDDFIGDGIEAPTAPVAEVEEIEKPESEPAELEGELKEEVQEEVKEEVVEEVEEKPATEEVDETVVSEVLSQLGYEFEEDFEDTSDGLIKLTKAVGGKMAEQQLDSLFEAHPEIQKHLDYVLNGGKSEEWLKMSNQITDFESIKVTEDDQRTQRAVLGEYFKLKGHDSEFINELLDDYTDTNKLYDKATKAKGALTSYYGKKKRRVNCSRKANENSRATKTKRFLG